MSARWDAIGDRLVRAALEAIEPRRCTREAIARVGIDRPVTLFALGKAARGMTAGALEAVDVTRGIVIAPDDAPIDARLRVVRGGHPAPAPDAAEHGDAVLSLARSVGEDDVALVLVSGGGSAMLERPIAGVSIEEIARAARALMEDGADIAELNAVRRCVSEIKGGGLARALHPARVVVIVISDVPGRPASLVASGPCSAIGDDAPDPREVLARHRGAEIPDTVRDAVRARAELRPDDAIFARVEVAIAAESAHALEGVRREAERLGITLGIERDAISGDAAIEAQRFAARARAAGGGGLLAGGETTVEVRGGGRGGRSQHAALALAASGALGDATFAGIATDGIDGTSDAAGGFVDRAVLARASARGLDPRAHLARCDADAWLAGAEGRIVTGPTGTNVADVWIWLG